MAVFSILWTALSMLIPNVFIRFFMTPTPEVLEIAPTIFRCYGLSFLLLPLNIFSTYYFQALMKPKTAFIASVARGLVISGILIYLLPAVFTGNAIWFAMPVTELIVALLYSGICGWNSGCVSVWIFLISVIQLCYDSRDTPCGHSSGRDRDSGNTQTCAVYRQAERGM